MAQKPTNLAEFLLRSIVVRAQNRDTKLQYLKQYKEKFIQFECFSCDEPGVHQCSRCEQKYCKDHVNLYGTSYCVACKPKLCETCAYCNQLVADSNEYYCCNKIVCYMCSNRSSVYDVALGYFRCGQCDYSLSKNTC